MILLPQFMLFEYVVCVFLAFDANTFQNLLNPFIKQLNGTVPTDPFKKVARTMKKYEKYLGLGGPFTEKSVREFLESY